MPLQRLTPATDLIYVIFKHIMFGFLKIDPFTQLSLPLYQPFHPNHRRFDKENDF